MLTNLAKVTSTLKDTNLACCFCAMLLLESLRICIEPNMSKNWNLDFRVSKGVEQEVQTSKIGNSRLQKALLYLWVVRSRTPNPQKNCKKSFRSNGIKEIQHSVSEASEVDLAALVDALVDNRRHSISCSTTSMWYTTQIRSG